MEENNHYLEEDRETENAQVGEHLETRTRKKEAIVRGISQEIKGEKIRLLILNIFTWTMFAFTFIINLLWILQITDAIDLDVDQEFSFFVPWISVPLFILALILVVYSGLSSYTFEQEKKFHFANVEDIDVDRVPNFIIEKYKNISGLMIFYNWFAAFSYIFTAITLTYFFLFRNREMIPLPGGLEIRLADDKSFPSYTWDIVWTFVYLSVVFILQIGVIIYSVREKSRLSAIFDLKKKMDYEEIKKYERKINIICFVLFMLPVVILLIAYWLSRRLRKKQ